jgi:hypothetical protein
MACYGTAIYGTDLYGPCGTVGGIYLGLNGMEVFLPPLRWRNGEAPGVPIDASKSLESATMVNGIKRYNIREKQPRGWAFAWDMLTEAELAEFVTLQGYNSRLHFLNTWEGTTWRWVVISEISTEPVVKLGGAVDNRYRVGLALKEVI